MAITTGKVGSLQIINVSAAFTTEATTEVGGTAVYTIDDSGKLPWDPNEPITVSTGTLDRTYMDEGVNWFTGQVGMTASGLGALTVTGKFVTLQTVAEISGWSYAMNTDAGETTEVGQSWKTNLALGNSATLTLNRYRFDTLFDHVADEDWILIKLYEDADSGFWVKCFRGNIAYTKAINAIDTDAITFEVSSPISYFS